MSSEMTGLAGTLLEGWREILTLFLLLLLASALMGWVANRGLRPVERGPMVPALSFIAAFALLLIVRHVHNDRWNALIIAGGIALAALLVARTGTRAPVLPLMFLAVLLGFGLHLSAVALFVAALLVLGLTRPAVR